MKRIFFTVAFVLFLVLCFAGWRLFGPATAFSGPKYDLYIRTGMSYDELLQLLDKDTVIKSRSTFDFLAGRLDYKTNVKAGKYEIPGGMNLISMIRMLRNGHQTPVHFTVAKVRTREGLSGMIGRKLECDSLSFLHFSENNDSLAQFGVDSNTFITLVLPNTYTFFWNTTPSAVMKKFAAFSKSWWTPERIQQAKAKGLTPIKAYILASIVEEETNASADKGKIASVYLNRMTKGMRLAADPTVKFAMRDFELRRIYEKYTKFESPYNTYMNAGLPPGPICTPSEQTLDAVLQSPATDYLYFVAKPGNSGLSNFASTFKEHVEYANTYRKWLDEQMAIRAHEDSLKMQK